MCGVVFVGVEHVLLCGMEGDLTVVWWSGVCGVVFVGMGCVLCVMEGELTVLW